MTRLLALALVEATFSARAALGRLISRTRFEPRFATQRQSDMLCVRSRSAHEIAQGTKAAGLLAPFHSTVAMEPNIKHDPERRSFGTEVQGGIAHLDYRLGSGVMTIVHTEVPPEIEGHGIAGALVRSALGHAERAGLKVEPVCAYARAYMDHHPETAALRA